LWAVRTFEELGMLTRHISHACIVGIPENVSLFGPFLNFVCDERNCVRDKAM
jgi:hypothetical protein